MKSFLKKWLKLNENETFRTKWLRNRLSTLPAGAFILDAGAGELRNKSLCERLVYVSQDFCQYEGVGDGKGLQTGEWNTSRIDIVSDIVNIPVENASFDAILCSEVLEHIPDPVKALDEFARVLKPGGILILTAPFVSLVHFAPYHFCAGFSRYWYEHHLEQKGFDLVELTANGDWFSLLKQEIFRLPGAARRYGDRCWPLAYVVVSVSAVYFALRSKAKLNATDLACFGWHCIARKRIPM